MKLNNMNTQNLKPFNLERALAGDPVVTRDGMKVTQIVSLKADGLSVVGVIEGWNDICRWYPSGGFLRHNMNEIKDASSLDLFMAPVEKSGWIKIFPQQAGAIKATTSCIYDNEADALNFMFPDAPTGIIVQIKWTE